MSAGSFGNAFAFDPFENFDSIFAQNNLHHKMHQQQHNFMHQQAQNVHHRASSFAHSSNWLHFLYILENLGNFMFQVVAAAAVMVKGVKL